MPNTLNSKPKKYSDLPAAEKVTDVTAWLAEHKATDVEVIDLTGRGSFTDMMVIATANSVRHAQSLAGGVNQLCGEKNYEYLRMDGYTLGQWIIVDCNDFVVNIFLKETRSLYKLEDLWRVPQSREELQAMADQATEEKEEEDA